MATAPTHSGNESYSEPATNTVNGTVMSMWNRYHHQYLAYTKASTPPLSLLAPMVRCRLREPHTSIALGVRYSPKTEHPDGALEMFSYPEAAQTFVAVLITGSGITYEQHSPIWHALLDNYVQKGGRVVICCGFPYVVIPRDFDAMLAGVGGLGWRVAGCPWSEYLKDEPKSQVKDSLDDAYNWNAVTLKAEGMKAGESWYSNTEGDSAAAMARVGGGGGSWVMLGMCALMRELQR
ncbi:hypothetical protein QBC36DRAFT_314087 [Triangularia setosa]|uniref:Uncharacterized protein n=1 Tax=Triangularia setosa TaxID=2587417 RepID=A0AAN7A400_9PEZI|nr:hypothetical protein QBC36DRAFT_314087 [Podospora setosa]